MTHILITGGTGYVGRFIVENALASGETVTVAGRHPPSSDLFSRPVGFRPLELDPQADFAALLDGVDALVHAAFHHVPGKYRGGEGADPAAFLRANGNGSIALFEAARRCGVHRAVFLSSRAVYGVQAPGTALHEDMICRPDTLYGHVKLDVEHALSALDTPRFVAASLRVTGVYGSPRRAAPHKWDALFADFLAGQPIASRAGTEVHGADVARAIRLAIEAPAASVAGKVFNVSDMMIDRHDLLSLVRDATQSRHAPPPPVIGAEYNAMATDRIAYLGWSAGGMPLLRRTVEELVASASG
jgi:nucleoside-diphosphate-sugar epimerase